VKLYLIESENDDGEYFDLNVWAPDADAAIEAAVEFWGDSADRDSLTVFEINITPPSQAGLVGIHNPGTLTRIK
jgi:hypothetical protein